MRALGATRAAGRGPPLFLLHSTIVAGVSSGPIANQFGRGPRVRPARAAPSPVPSRLRLYPLYRTSVRVEPAAWGEARASAEGASVLVRRFRHL